MSGSRAGLVGEASAARNRTVSTLLVLAFVAALRGGSPSPEARATWLYLVALPIGYGHLIGGLWFARARIRERVPQELPRGLVATFAGVSVANLLAAYTWALHVPALLAWVLVPMLLVSAWQIVENDLALGQAYRRGLELGGTRVDTRHNLVALGVTGLIAFAALLTPTGAYYASDWFGWRVSALAFFTIDELATAVLLYHAVAWLLFFWERSRRLARRDPPAAARLRTRLVALHVVPLAGNALLYSLRLPGSGAPHARKVRRAAHLLGQGSSLLERRSAVGSLTGANLRIAQCDSCSSGDTVPPVSQRCARSMSPTRAGPLPSTSSTSCPDGSQSAETD